MACQYSHTGASYEICDILLKVGNIYFHHELIVCLFFFLKIKSEINLQIVHFSNLFHHSYFDSSAVIYFLCIDTPESVKWVHGLMYSIPLGVSYVLWPWFVFNVLCYVACFEEMHAWYMILFKNLQKCGETLAYYF